MVHTLSLILCRFHIVHTAFQMALLLQEQTGLYNQYYLSTFYLEIKYISRESCETNCKSLKSFVKIS